MLKDETEDQRKRYRKFYFILIEKKDVWHSTTVTWDTQGQTKDPLMDELGRAGDFGSERGSALIYESLKDTHRLMTALINCIRSDCDLLVTAK